MTGFLAELAAALGPEAVTPGPEVPERHRQDWAALPPVEPLALLRPRSTEEVAAALRLCQAAGVPVVVQGGLTGLAGGAHPVPGGVALSLERMARVIAVDPAMATLEAEAGCTLAAAQEAAAAAGLLFPVDLGARGSCTLGGIIGTNAGGIRVLRHGMTREHVLGLEAVLADGTVLPALNRLVKNNAGIDLKQLLIGSEGTIGVVTRAVFRLQPSPAHRATAFCGCPDAAAMVALLAAARAALGPELSAFEAMWPGFYDTMRAGIGAPHPLAGRHGVYVLLEASGFDDRVRERLEACLAGALAAGLIADAALAASGRDERAFWAVRESVAEFRRLFGQVASFDVGVTLECMAGTVARIEAEVAAGWPGARALCYGHMGDGNLHVVVHVPGLPEPPEAVSALVYGIVRAAGGTVSAEHGIGTLKRPYLPYCRSAEELAAMRAVKAALDPKGILNPGKSFAP